MSASPNTLRPIDKVINEAAVDGPAVFEGLAAVLHNIRKQALDSGRTDAERINISLPLIHVARLTAALAITTEVLQLRQDNQKKVSV